MISKLSLINFKAFSSLEGLRIAPLTVICGKNSCGKSSILHSLLLLKQSIDSDYTGEALLIDGKYVQYSHLREIVFGLPSEASAFLSYNIELSKSSGEKLGDLGFEFRYKKLSGQAKKGVVVNEFTWKKHDEKQENKIKRVKNKFSVPRKLKLQLPPLPKSWALDSIPTITFDHFLPRSVRLRGSLIQSEDDNNRHKRPSIEIPVGYAMHDLGNLINKFQSELERIRYLGPSRAVPRRAYVHYSESNYDLDEDGANAAHIFWLRRNELINWRSRKVKLEDAVNDCLKIMGLEQPITPKQSSRIVYQLEVGIDNNNKKRVTIADVGFGYSQILPIILRGLLSPANSLIILEQPEIHLHPSSCANLADLFLEFTNNNKRILVETHSAELINRLRLRVIENEKLSKKINIAFINSPGPEIQTGSSLTQINLQSDGMLDEWPDGFCDESEKLARAILEARINRSIDNV